MNIKKVLCVLAVLLICAYALVRVSAETSEARNIYVGDIIALEIASPEFSEEELRQKFQDFEIVEIKKSSSGHLLSIRTFNVGEYKIFLGGKEIVINVSSTLDDIQRDGIFEGEANVIEHGFIFYWRILFYIAASIFVLSGGFVFVKTMIKRKTKTESPYELFLRRSAALSAKDNGYDNYFVDLTFYLKEYLGTICNHRIIGKTSAEIVNELKELHAFEDMISDIQKWLTECDMFKFSGVEASSDEKHRHYIKLLSLAEKIETNRNQSDNISYICDTNERTEGTA